MKLSSYLANLEMIHVKLNLRIENGENSLQQRLYQLTAEL